MTTILLVGAGYVGREIGGLLLNEGCTVFGAARSERSIRAPFPTLLCDVTDASSLRALAVDPDFLVYGVSPGTRSAEAYRAVYEVGVKNALDVFPRARFALISSTAVYGTAEGALTETTPISPSSPLEESLARAEELVLRTNQAHLVLRASGIYGPGRTTLLRRLLTQPLDELEQTTTTNRIHRDDLAGLIAFLFARPTVGGLFLATDCEPATLGEMQTYVRAHPFANAALARLPTEDSKPSRGARPPRKSRTLSNQRVREIGYCFRFPSFREGYTSLLDALSAERPRN